MKVRHERVGSVVKHEVLRRSGRVGPAQTFLDVLLWYRSWLGLKMSRMPISASGLGVFALELTYVGRLVVYEQMKQNAPAKEETGALQGCRGAGARFLPPGWEKHRRGLFQPANPGGIGYPGHKTEEAADLRLRSTAPDMSPYY